MTFKEWFKVEFKQPYKHKDYMEMAWDAAINEAEKIVAERYDEQEPWLDPGEISKITKGI